MKEALEQNKSKEEIKEEQEPEGIRTEEEKSEEKPEPGTVQAEEDKPEEEPEPGTVQAEEDKPEEEPEPGTVQAEEDKPENIQEPKEAQEAATMELTAEPYVIPKAAFKMPVWAKACIITAATLLLVYGAGSLFFSGHFMWNSSLNGVDVSLLTAAQAQEKLETVVEQYELEILERDGERETIAGADIQLDIRFLADARGVMQQQKVYLWFLECFRSKAYTLDTQITYDIRSLQEQIQGLACMQKENITEPVEPQIKQVLGTFTVQEGIEGNKPLAYAVGKSIRTAVSSLSTQVDLEAEGCYAALEYRAEDSVVQEALATLEKLQKVKITYRFPDTEETLTGDVILKWVRISEDYEVEIDLRKAEDYVEYLMENHEIQGQTIDFQTSLNQSVEVTSYLRSSEVDTEEEAAELVALLEQALDTRRTEFVRDASDMTAIGDTYIEINLTSQHLYCYKDGEMILETDIVSGRPSTGHATPPGVFTIRYTASPAILVGEDYRTPVSYWMPFNGGIGLHDATWQYAFGGSRYISNGSHGCINLPLNMAREIYNNYEAGDIVVVYHLAGSEAGSSTSSTASVTAPASAAAEEAQAAPEEGAETPASTAEALPADAEVTEASSEQAEPMTEETTENQNP